MKMLKKTLAVVLSLVLCGSLVAPSFAAVEFNKDQHVDAETGALLKNSEDNYDYYLGGDVTLDKTLVVGAGVAANIDLNGHTLAGSGNGSVIKVDGQDASLTVNDKNEDAEYEHGDGTGTITGGTGTTIPGNISGGGGVYVENGSLTLNGGSISGNTADYGGGVYVGNGDFTMNGGSVTENTAKTNGGGVYNHWDGTLTMNDGEISENEAKYGGGVYNRGGTFTMTDGEISGNTATSVGGGVRNDSIESTYYGDHTGTFYMNGGKISGNTAGNYGGGIDNQQNSVVLMESGSITGNKAKTAGGVSNSGTINRDTGIVSEGLFTMKGGEISGNSAENGAGGVYNNIYGRFTMTGGKLYDNTASWADDLQNVDGGTVYLPDAGSMGVELEDGTKVTGWYFDANEGWSQGEYAYFNYGSLKKGVKSALYIKAAHDEYFVVTDSEGNELYNVEKGTEVELPVLEREGYTFLGWFVGDELVEGTLTVDQAMALEAKWEHDEPEQPTTPSEPVITPDEPEDPTVEIDEPDVPLADLPVDLEPMDNLTRGQLIRILHWMDSEPAAELATFIDVLGDSDYAEAIGWAQANGIALGVGSNRFAPDEYVTRGQLIAFLNRYAQYVGSDLVLEVEGDANEVLTWAEAEEIINDFFDRL